MDAPDNPGVYTFSISQTESNADLVVLSVVSATANVVIDEVVIYTRNHDGLVDAILDEAMSGHTTAGTLGGALQSVYWADINFTVTDDETKDRYSARWFKDGTRLTSGITSPTITVTRRADGAVLINAAALTDVGSGMLYYSATGAERQTLGHAYEVSVSATIDAATRTWTKNLSRDV